MCDKEGTVEIKSNKENKGQEGGIFFPQFPERNAFANANGRKIGQT